MFAAASHFITTGMQTNAKQQLTISAAAQNASAKLDAEKFQCRTHNTQLLTTCTVLCVKTCKSYVSMKQLTPLRGTVVKNVCLKQ